MKDLSLEPTIVEDSDYLNGKIEDGTTKITEHVNQDIVQLFEKIKSYGETPNGLFDNETNGYQLIEALRRYVGRQCYIPRGNTVNEYDFTTSTFDSDEHILDLEALGITKYGRENEIAAVKIKVYVVSLGAAALSHMIEFAAGNDTTSTDRSTLWTRNDNLNMAEFIVPVNSDCEIGYRVSLSPENIGSLNIKVTGFFYGRWYGI